MSPTHRCAKRKRVCVGGSSSLTVHQLGCLPARSLEKVHRLEEEVFYVLGTESVFGMGSVAISGVTVLGGASQLSAPG